jgi:hypothetical protein
MRNKYSVNADIQQKNESLNEEITSLLRELKAKVACFF